ncbi:MAG: putative cation/proton antiporter YbaL [Turneriella sp.]|nr:putative cation/proton antiporter YbaL [Turneriella sp.]
MHNVDLILTLVAGFTAALLFGLITHRIGLSPIVGYLIAGIAIGPNTPGIVANHDLAEQLAEIGVVLLMFGVGLQFDIKELWAARRIALPVALLQTLAAFIFSSIAVHFFHWSLSAGILFGLAISISSTVVVLRVLVDANDLHTPIGRIAVAWLVMEDLLTVFVIVLLPIIFGGQNENLVSAISIAFIKIIALIVVAISLGIWVIPRLLTAIAQTGSRELFTLAVLVLALGIAVGSTLLFGVSMALGAFLAGMVVGRSEFSLRAATDAIPMRDAFAVLFFVSVGMLFDFRNLVASPYIVFATIAVIIFVKPLGAFLILTLLGYPARVAISVGAVLTQIAEFSFIVAVLGTKLKILPADAANILVAVAIITITLNPMIYRTAQPLEKWLRHFPLLHRFFRFAEKRVFTESEIKHESADASKRRAVVIGYGPVGRTVSRLLAENGFTPIVIDLNLNTLRELKARAMPVIYGDASHIETLKRAGLAEADILILSASSIRGGKNVIREARQLNPKIKVLARTAYLRDAPDLQSAGADAVFTGEGEVALSITEFIMSAFGATPEQIERERERVRAKLFIG